MKLRALLIATLAGVGLSAMANTAATDSMYVNDFTVKQGDTVQVAVNFKNTTAYAATQGDLTISNTQVTPVQHYDETLGGDVYFSRSSRMTSFSIADRYHADKNMVRFVHFDLANKQVAAGDGALLYIYITAAKEATPGTYQGTITKTHYSTGIASENYVNDGDGPDTKFTITVEKDESGVTDATIAKTVSSVKYYNIAGQQSATPFEGVNVVVKTFTDGSKAVSKQVLK